MKQVANLITQSVTLTDGTILAAAGTTGSVKQVENLSDEDQRLVDRGFVHVSEVEFVSPPAPSSTSDSKERSK